MCIGNKDTSWKEKRDGWRLRGRKASKYTSEECYVDSDSWSKDVKETTSSGLWSLLKCKIGWLYGTTDKVFWLEDTNYIKSERYNKEGKTAGVKESGELFSKPEMLNDLNVMLNKKIWLRKPGKYTRMTFFHQPVTQVSQKKGLAYPTGVKYSNTELQEPNGGTVEHR